MNIYLDVDEVVCDFMSGIKKRYPELKDRDESKYELPNFIDWNGVYKDAPFWLMLPVLDRPTVKVSGFVSHRKFPIYITEFWLHINRFQPTDVYHVDSSDLKVELLKKLNCDLYVDDKPQTFEHCLQEGLNACLYTRPWNLHLQTDRRISKLSELEGLL